MSTAQGWRERWRVQQNKDHSTKNPPQDLAKGANWPKSQVSTRLEETTTNKKKK